jgi:hypothetical protein
MPKLPSFFSNSNRTPLSRSSDEHQGRKRATPHRENSWATYVYFQGLAYFLFLGFFKKKH